MPVKDAFGWMDISQNVDLYGIALIASSVLLRVVAVLIAARIALYLGGLLVDRALMPRKQFGFYLDERKIKTLSPLLKSILRYTIDFMATVAVLRIFNIPTESIIATAGIGGLAIGFGAQNLVKDVITGFFIIFEDQFSVGDYIEAAGISGIVEEMGLRVTKVRDFGGQLHILPNGEITKVTNHSRGNMRAMVDVRIPYEVDIDKAMAVIDRVCKELKQKREDITEGPSVLGVNELSDSGIYIRVWATTLPMQQWSLERQLRKEIKEAFDQEGIEIPYPKMVLIQRNN
jgi:small-conductance mechanosensitive channel